MISHQPDLLIRLSGSLLSAPSSLPTCKLLLCPAGSSCHPSDGCWANLLLNKPCLPQQDMAFPYCNRFWGAIGLSHSTQALRRSLLSSLRELTLFIAFNCNYRIWTTSFLSCISPFGHAAPLSCLLPSENTHLCATWVPIRMDQCSLQLQC